MIGVAEDGALTHASTGQAKRDFLPGGFGLRRGVLPAEPQRWMPLSRGECPMTLRRAVSAQRG